LLPDDNITEVNQQTSRDDENHGAHGVEQDSNPVILDQSMFDTSIEVCFLVHSPQSFVHLLFFVTNTLYPVAPQEEAGSKT
jgi:hypothetical protein